MQRLERIPIEQIERDATQPREHFDEAELLKLADNLKAVGQQVPCLVVELTDSEGSVR